jgi:ribose 5-phosphate isomerase B
VHVYLATDHAGFALKEHLVEFLTRKGYAVHDLGAPALDPNDDYPELIAPCAEAIVAAEGGALGIVIGSSGQGEAMVANRTKGIRATVFYGEAKAPDALDAEGTHGTDGYDIVRISRQHNDANILSLGARFITEAQAEEAVTVFLSTPFSTEERHQRRLLEF